MRTVFSVEYLHLKDSAANIDRKMLVDFLLIKVPNYKAIKINK